MMAGGGVTESALAGVHAQEGTEVTSQTRMIVAGTAKTIMPTLNAFTRAGVNPARQSFLERRSDE